MTKTKQMQNMIDDCKDMIRELGSTDGDFYEMNVDTKYGKLGITVREGFVARGQDANITIFTRFEESDTVLGGPNGKWNWHGLRDRNKVDKDDEIHTYQYFIENMLKPILT